MRVCLCTCVYTRLINAFNGQRSFSFSLSLFLSLFLSSLIYLRYVESHLRKANTRLEHIST